MYDEQLYEPVNLIVEALIPRDIVLIRLFIIESLIFIVS